LLALLVGRAAKVGADVVPSIDSHGEALACVPGARRVIRIVFEGRSKRLAYRPETGERPGRGSAGTQRQPRQNKSYVFAHLFVSHLLCPVDAGA
jgi:hypothetical protein